MSVPGPTKRTELADRIDALKTAADAASGRLPRAAVQNSREALRRAAKRRELSRAHTVVALAGATGGGKSTLFNEISGLTISPVGVKRPTTSYPMACVWGTLGVAPLLDWLGVPRRHQIARESVLDSGAQDELDGLVLLDLPDHDSTEDEHRHTVERLIEQVDVFVWVVDPQKYADAALHERYLQPLAAHRTVTAVVLNQADRLDPADVKRCVDDLRELLNRDGLPDVPILPMSALTGEGVGQFTDLLRNAVSKQRAHDDRIAADIRTAAEELAGQGGQATDDVGGDGEAGKDNAGGAGVITETDRDQLIHALADAAGINVVADSVGRSYLNRVRRSTGWPFSRWIGNLRRDPLRSLGLGRESVPELASSSRRTPASVQSALSDSAIRQLGDAAAGAAPRPWRTSIRNVARSAAAEVPVSLDQAISAADVETDSQPRWAAAARAVQWAGVAAVLAGALWLVVLGIGSLLEVDIPAPRAGGVAVPTLVLVAGLVLGLATAATGYLIAKVGARRRAVATRHRLTEIVKTVADSVVIKPVQAELDRFQAFRRAVRTAASR